MKIILLIACLAIGVRHCFCLENKNEWLLQLVNSRNEWEPDTPTVLEKTSDILCIIRTIAVRPKRSVGGTAIPISQAPYFVTIKDNGHHICGGAFVSKKHIITAAHCLYDDTYRRYPGLTVVSGTNRKNTGGTPHQIERAVYPAGYNATIHQDDIAVITLTAPVTWDLNRNLIALPIAEPSYNQKATLIAFKTRVNVLKDAPLQQLEIKMVRAAECLGNYPEHIPLYTNMFCGKVENDEATFVGDSGGPLVYRRRLVGVVSSGGKVNFQSAFYTNVYKFVHFINAAMAQ